MSKLIETLTISDVGSWASIIGLTLTFVTFLLLFSIKKKFLFRSSVDDHMKEISDISSEVSLLLRSYHENQKDIDELFALANVELRAMQRGVKNGVKPILQC